MALNDKEKELIAELKKRSVDKQDIIAIMLSLRQERIEFSEMTGWLKENVDANTEQIFDRLFSALGLTEDE